MTPCYGDCAGWDAAEAYSRSEAERSEKDRLSNELSKANKENAVLLKMVAAKRARPEDIAEVKRILETEIDRESLLEERRQIMYILEKTSKEITSLSKLVEDAKTRVHKITNFLDTISNMGQRRGLKGARDEDH